MNFKKVNNITGWLVFAIATLTYTLTREARVLYGIVVNLWPVPLS